MARIIPEGWREMTAPGAVQREIETLEVLATGLPDDYTVYHGVHWTRIQQGHALVGEIDFAIVSPAGKLLLIEQKSGFLSETAEGLVKIYAAREKSVAFQMRRTSEALHSRLRNFCPEAGFVVDALLYCPDYTVRNPETAGLVPERIVDAVRRDQLCPIIQRLLSVREETPATPKIHAFLRDLGRVKYDVVSDDEAIDAFFTLSRMEGIIPAIESAHAVAFVRRLAPELAPGSVVLVNLSGRGDKDMYSVAAFRGGPGLRRGADRHTAVFHAHLPGDPDDRATVSGLAPDGADCTAARGLTQAFFCARPCPDLARGFDDVPVGEYNLPWRGTRVESRG